MQNEQQHHPAVPIPLGGIEAVQEARRSSLDRFRRLAACGKQRLFPYVNHRRRCHKPVQDRLTLTSHLEDRSAKPELRDSIQLSEQCLLIRHRDLDCLRKHNIDPDRVEHVIPVEIPIDEVKKKMHLEPAQKSLEEKFLEHATVSFRQHPEPLEIRLDLIQLAHEWGIFVYRAAMLTDQAGFGRVHQCDCPKERTRSRSRRFVSSGLLPRRASNDAVISRMKVSTRRWFAISAIGRSRRPRRKISACRKL